MPFTMYERSDLCCKTMLPGKQPGNCSSLKQREKASLALEGRRIFTTISHIWLVTGFYKADDPSEMGRRIRNIFANTFIYIFGYKQKVDDYTCILMTLVLCVTDRCLKLYCVDLGQ